MIKLSKLTDYAVVILASMAEQKNLRMSASELSKMTSLPEPTVSKILKILAKSEVITSARGVNGGYLLMQNADKLMISKIITAMEGPIALTSCVKDSNESCSLEGLCQLHGRWNIVNTALKSALDEVSLADMMTPSHMTKAHYEEGRL